VQKPYLIEVADFSDWLQYGNSVPIAGSMKVVVQNIYKYCRPNTVAGFIFCLSKVKEKQ